MDNNNKQLRFWKLLALFLFFALITVTFFALRRSSGLSVLLPEKAEKAATENFIIPTVIPSSKAPLTQKTGLFLSSLPKPIEKLTLEDIPSYRTIRGVAKYNDKYFFTGEGMIIETDPKTSQIIRYTDPKTYYCGNNLAIIGDFLYAPCVNGNVNNASTDFYSHYEVYKISLINNSIVQKYGKQEGILSGANFQVFADGDILWVATFEGLGKIDTKNNKVNFYSSGLGIAGTKFGVNDVLIDKDYAWFYVTANSYSAGGLVMFNKATGVFKPFSILEIKNKQDRFDLDFGTSGYGWKLIPGGIKVAFRDADSSGKEVSVIKNYNYESGKWVFETSVSIATSGDYIAKNFPEGNHFRLYESIDGLSKLITSFNNGVRETVDLEGRSPLLISPTINGKRYILTSGSVDVIDETMAFPKILLKTNESLSYTEPSTYDRANVNFLIDKETLQAIVLVRPVCGEGCTGAIVFFIDLNKEIITKRFEIPNEEIANRKFGDETMTKAQGQYVVNDSTGSPLFSVNENSLKLTVY